MSIIKSKKNYTKLWIFIWISLALCVASYGLVRGLISGNLLNGHDTGSYAIYVTEFHENIRSGVLFPVWAADLDYGYGEPHLQFRPPLQLYLTEFCYLITGHPFAAIYLCAFLILLFAATGMYRFGRSFFEILEIQNRAPALALAVGYVLSPYLLLDLYVRGALGELTGFAVMPWLAYGFLKLSQDITIKNFVRASFLFLLLVLSHPAVCMFVTPILILLPLFYWKQQSIRRLGVYYGAVFCGILGSSFYWLATFLEKDLIKSALQAEGYEAFNHHFLNFTQMFFHAWDYQRGANLTLGLLATWGLLWGIWTLTRTSLSATRDNSQNTKVVLILSSIMGAGLYLMHWASEWSYELIPILQVATFPWRILSILTFIGAVLGTLGLYKVITHHRYWNAILMVFLVLAAFEVQPQYSKYKAEDFLPKNIASHGMGFYKPFSTPSNLGLVPKQPYQSRVELLTGMGQIKCGLSEPTRIQCHIDAFDPIEVRLNVLSYPHWSAYLNGQKHTQERSAITGTLSLNVPKGAHAVEWRLEDTKVRHWTKVISISTWFILVVLWMYSLKRQKESPARLSTRISRRKA